MGLRRLPLLYQTIAMINPLWIRTTSLASATFVFACFYAVPAIWASLRALQCAVPHTGISCLTPMFFLALPLVLRAGPTPTGVDGDAALLLSPWLWTVTSMPQSLFCPICPLVSVECAHLMPLLGDCVHPHKLLWL